MTCLPLQLLTLPLLYAKSVVFGVPGAISILFHTRCKGTLRPIFAFPCQIPFALIFALKVGLFHSFNELTFNFVTRRFHANLHELALPEVR